MLTILSIAGKQFKAKKDSILYVPKLSEAVGNKITFTDILAIIENDIIMLGGNGKVVEAEVTAHLKGEKVTAFKMKRRKGFRKKKGHRTDYTCIKILSIA